MYTTNKFIYVCELLHELCLLRFFCGVAATPKQQRMLIENFYNECFKVSLFQLLQVLINFT